MTISFHVHERSLFYTINYTLLLYNVHCTTIYRVRTDRRVYRVQCFLSSELDPLAPSPASEYCPPFGSEGGDTLACGKGGGANSDVESD